MSFYTEQSTTEEQQYYDQTLQMIGSLSNLFSESKKPYLASRFTENAFCRCLLADNLSRGDVTADAMKNNIGVGIKTWVDSDLQKIAEFNALKPHYENDSDEIMIKKIAQYRNDRISFTMRTYNLHSMIYHCTIREEGKINIIECPLSMIDIPNIQNIVRKRNVITFTDGINKYSFNTSKSTLYKRFDEFELIKTLSVEIIDDPFDYLAQKMGIIEEQSRRHMPRKDGILIETAVLPLYSTKKGGIKYVPPKNNLNMRHAGGRKRDPYEVGIPIPADFRKKHPAFFLGIDKPFELKLPNGKKLIAKQCQQDGKALMSNPNKDLGHWLIDDVLQIDPSILITYEMLNQYGIDAVRLEKIWSTKEQDYYYEINFAKSGSYEAYMKYGFAYVPEEGDEIIDG